jgi:hypothetical protein
MEVFRNALLVSLIVILAYILYKRLVQFLQRDKLVSTDYAHIPRFNWKDGVLKIELELPRQDVVTVQVGQEGEFITLEEKQLSRGIHELDFPLPDLKSGKKICRVHTSTKKLERFFTVE